LFLSDETPRYLTAIKALARMFGSCIFFTVYLGVIVFAENRRKDFVVAKEIADENSANFYPSNGNGCSRTLSYTFEDTVAAS
jgi:hypothetical protein